MFENLPYHSYLGLVRRKPLSGVCSQVRLKPNFTASEASYSIEIMHIEKFAIMLFRKCIKKAQIRLCRFTVLSAPLLLAWHSQVFLG